MRLIISEMLCSPDSIHVAASGNPIGLTKNATTKRIIPFLNELVSITATASMLINELAIPNANAEQDNKPQQIQVKKSIIKATGNIIILSTVLIKIPPTIIIAR